MGLISPPMWGRVIMVLYSLVKAMSQVTIGREGVSFSWARVARERRGWMLIEEVSSGGIDDVGVVETT
jgi:hypothetical protein